MENFIDLTSPEKNRIQTPKLTSPLIPLPKYDETQNEPINLPSRRSLEDNPFDAALKKTNEYISKLQDPFETMFERAVNNQNGDEFEQTLSAEFKDDYSCQRQRHPDIEKLNKTVSDSSSLSPSIMLNNQRLSLSAWKNFVTNDLTESNQQLKDFSTKVATIDVPNIEKNSIPLIMVNSASTNVDLSILNESEMNTTFDDDVIGDAISNVEDFMAKTIPISASEINKSNQLIALHVEQTGENNKFADKINHHYRQLRRSLSQGGISTHKIKQIRSQSIIGNSHIRKSSDENSFPSMLFDSPFNNGFLIAPDNKYCTISDISSISNASTNTKLNSVVSNCSPSSGNSINPINNAFIKSNLSANEKSYKMQRAATSLCLPSTKSLVDMTDLVKRYNSLKLSMEGSELNSSVFDEEKYFADVKCSITSDSVFVEDENRLISSNGVQKHDSKSKLSTSNCSVGDDFLPKKIPNELNLSIENEILVDNLIELHTSNNSSKGEANKNTPVYDQSLQLKMPDDKDEMLKNKNEMKISDVVEGLEKELIEPKKKPLATVLLMELQKLLTTENNPKAVELVRNLAEQIGVKCHSNVELLECVKENDQSNDDSIIKPHTTTAAIIKENFSATGKNANVNNVSEEDNNVNVEKIDNCIKTKELNDGNIVYNNLNNDKCVSNKNTDDDISLSINDKFDYGDNKEKENLFGTQKLVTDVLLALRKLLNDYDGESPSFLENLKHVLDPIPSENKSSDVELKKNSKSSSLRLSPRKSSHVANRSLKPPVRYSVDSNSVKRPTLIKRRNSTSQLPEKKEVKKRTSGHVVSSSVKEKPKSEVLPTKIKPTVPVFAKPKLKKKTEIEVSAKKGPLKAVIPLGNMQKKPSSGMRVSIVVEPTTPPKISETSTIGKTSTPNLEHSATIECLKKPKKVKPVASSTPQLTTKNVKSTGLSVPQSPRHNMSWNISPVTPNAANAISSSKVKNDLVKRVQSNKVPAASPKTRNVIPRRLEPSPQESEKSSSSVHNNSSRNSISKINHGQYSQPIKRAGNTLNKSLISEKPRKSISPLKEKNCPGVKNKQSNLIPKFRRRSVAGHTEKENKIKM